ncbi:unnamed protein product [Protopolystoma xenopodis]|uniref:Uncharacterized protein n=1 Tax=Protopolystoma xenopodis TaxID=117903 RepID=A0A3S5CNC7_9PLAT|nr:unnamed protein product [Protopolystoma xenopodis]
MIVELTSISSKSVVGWRDSKVGSTRRRRRIPLDQLSIRFTGKFMLTLFPRQSPSIPVKSPETPYQPLQSTSELHLSPEFAQLRPFEMWILKTVKKFSLNHRACRPPFRRQLWPLGNKTDQMTTSLSGSVMAVRNQQATTIITRLANLLVSSSTP